MVVHSYICNPPLTLQVCLQHSFCNWMPGQLRHCVQTSSSLMNLSMLHLINAVIAESSVRNPLFKPIISDLGDAAEDPAMTILDIMVTCILHVCPIKKVCRYH